MKRRATEALDGEQRLTKRFHLLNLEPNGTLYFPVSASKPPQPVQPQPRLPDNEYMQVEDTKDKVFIHDLDAELAELEFDNENPIFLPDVEKHLQKIPQHVLEGPQQPQSTELVLYKVPESISVPREQDSVRKAIIEARQRARERQTTERPHLPDAEPYMVDGIHNEAAAGRPRGVVNGGDSVKVDEVVEQQMDADDPDAMDLG